MELNHLEEYAIDCRDLLGLDAWRITVKEADRPANNDSTEGAAYMHARYQQATIYIKRGVEDEQARDTMMHEMVHLRLARTGEAVERIIELLPKKLRKHAEQLFEDGLEHDVEGLALALRRSIKPSDES